jgi:hypothetical protein
MSDRRTHRTIGTISGGGHAFAKAQQQPPEHLALDVLGGLLAGNLGARLADMFDPPLHPGRGGLAHNVVPVVAAGRVAVGALDGWQTQLRAPAARRAALRASAATPLERLWHALVELLCRRGAGALAGPLAGYGSHVPLDAFTPACLPLLA